jgi:hypothetical protein
MFLGHPVVARFFRRLTLLWAFVQLANAAIAVTLLLSEPVRTYAWARPTVSLSVTAAAIAISAFWFHASMRREGIKVNYAGAV